MEDHDFGLRTQGSWDDIVDFCAALADALTAVSGDAAVAEFADWKPERTESWPEMVDRTAEREVIRETQVEKDSDGTAAEMARAGHEVRKSGRDALKGDGRASMHDIGAAGNATARGLVPLLAKLVRGVERGVYHHIVGPTNPQFFESRPFTVTIDHHRFADHDYSATIHVADTELLDALRQELDTDG